MPKKRDNETELSASICTLLGLPARVFASLAHSECLCIGSALNDAKLRGEETALIDIGIGELSVRLSDMTIKFLPGDDLKAAYKTAVSVGIDPLEIALNKNIAKRLIDVCQEEL